MSVPHEPVLSPRAFGGNIAVWQGVPVSRARFREHVAWACERLPQRPEAILLCEDRYRFLVAFTACLLRQQVVLLPPNRSPGEIDSLSQRYPESYRLDDSLLDGLASAGSTDVTGDWRLPADRRVALVFTSGSTGVPRANPKTWGELVAGARRVRARLGLDKGPARQMVATVPPQHMFGLEMSILLPLQAGVTVHAGRPFFPQDILDALKELDGPRILVTTPLHLKALAEPGLAWPALEFILSATAPLSRELACQVVAASGAPVREIFGCSEAGAMATREIARETAWTLLGEHRLRAGEDGFYLYPEEGSDPIRLADRFRCLDARRFVVLGRDTDMVNIAGKRGSLGDLTGKLRAIPGVEDGVFLLPDHSPGGREPRLAALVVAPDLDTRSILKALAREIDEVFLPRPLKRVDRLPYTETGKLPRAALLAMLDAEGPSVAPASAAGGHGRA